MVWLTLDVRFHFFFSFTQFVLNVNCWFGFCEIMWYWFSNSCSAYASLALTSTHTNSELRCLYYFLLDYKSKRNNTIDGTAFSVAAAAANARGWSGYALAPFLTTKHLLVMRWMPTPSLFYLQICACTRRGLGLGVYRVWQHRCGIWGMLFIFSS